MGKAIVSLELAEGVGRPDRSRAGFASRGFTLIEILVVVAIIALLISVLLPSLRKARDQARAAACMSQIGQICRAENLYQTSNKEWIPGSPITTGYYFATRPGTSANPAWNSFVPGFNRFVVEWMDFSTPLQALMYGGHSIPRPRSGGELVATRRALFLKATDGLFNCPSNSMLYGAHPTPGGWPVIRSVSYLAMWTITRPGPGFVGRTTSEFPPLDRKLHMKADDNVVSPSSYVPRHPRLGRESMKVFIADGFRFYDKSNDEEILDYTTETRTAKGIMQGEPPSTFCTAIPDHHREYTMAKKYSWRHGDNNRIMAGFFDGHVESMLADTRGDGPFTGTAVHPKWYYPSNSVVREPSELHNSHIPPGTVLP